MKLEAAEILTTGWCPLNCKYCYIPKSQAMKKIHKEIVQQLKEGTFIESLKKIYGENLVYLSFWGTEPTLTLNLIEPWLPKIFATFPRLKEISFSTSMILPNPILKFVKALFPYEIKLNIQISIDGPSFVTDKNRFKGAAKEVSENFLYLVSSVQPLKTKLKIEFHWKPTFTIENIRYLNKYPKKINEYFEFFQNLNRKFEEINKNSNISLQKKSYLPTLAVPCKYTSSDGKEFAKFLKIIHQKGYQSTYSVRLANLLFNLKDLGKNKKIATCSAGFSNLGIEKKIHLCHRSFYLNEKKYIESILSEKNIENWDVSRFERGIIDLVNKKFIIDLNNQLEKNRLFYVFNNYHYFWKFQIGYTVAMLKELALAGQVDKIYLKDETLSTIFAIFINGALGCPIENILNTGNIHLQVVSLIRMFGNGAFQELLKEHFREKEPSFSLPNLSLKKNTNPKIYFYNFNVGSGIERAGNTFLEMLKDYRKKYPEKVIEYKEQNPPAILLENLIKTSPDVIIINEFFPRAIEAVYYYKLFKKDTKIILLNHCSDILLQIPNILIPEVCKDREWLVNQAFSQKIFDYIINLNYHPPNKPYPQMIKDRTIDLLHVLPDNIWKSKTPFLKRKKDFLYAVQILPHKLSPDFVEKFSKTKMKIDLVGTFNNDIKEFEDYNQKILKSKNFNYLGYCPPEKMPEIYNQYRFLVSARKGREPFWMVLLEALKTGTIPLIAIDSQTPENEWIKWAEGLYLQFETTEELIEKMEWYLKNKNKIKVLKEFDKFSKFIAKEINKRSNYKRTKEIFLSIIFS